MKPIFLFTLFIFSLIATQTSNACTFTIRLTDTFGDGWNGGTVKVQVAGVDVLTNVGSTFTSGSGPMDFTFNANTGQTISVTQTIAGSWPSEMMVQIVDPAGTVVLGPFNPTTTATSVVAGCPTPMTYSSSTVTQSSTATVSNCGTNQQIVCLQITTNGTAPVTPLNLTQIQTSFLGTASNTNIGTAKVYFTGNSSTFATTTLFGQATPGAGTYAINGNLNLVLGVNYLWLTYDLNNTATLGTTIDAQITQFTASSTNYTSITTTNPAGTRTISTMCQGPGGIATGLETWVRADIGTVGTTPITGWTNQAPGTAILINGAPNMNTSSTSYNYNPYVDFTAPVGILAGGAATNRQFLKLNGYSGQIGINYTSLFTATQLNDLTRVHTHLATIDDVTYGFPANGTLHGDADATGTIASILLEAYDITDFGTSSPAGTWKRNGVNISSNSVHTSQKQILAANCQTGGSTTLNRFFGGQIDRSDLSWQDGHKRDWKGPVAELIGYTTPLSAINVQKVETYMAIKYGITLSVNYIAPNGLTIYNTTAPYNLNIIGIGRDDVEALTQKQSHNDDDTVRIYLNTLSASNAANSGVFSVDASYVVAGATNGKMCATAGSIAEMPAMCAGFTLYSRIEREWKVTKTNMGQNFNMDFKLAPCGSPGTVNPGDLRLLVDDDGNFANGGTQCYFNGDGTGIVISYANPTITVSNIGNIHIPNNATKYITIASIQAVTPLPVNLLFYNANPCDRNVCLDWETASEYNCNHFTLYKSKDLVNWEFVTLTQGQGTSQVSHHYTEEDLNPYEGISYYQLNQFDHDQSMQSSLIRSVNLKPSSTFSIYPNPTNQSFSIAIDDQLSHELEIIDQQGKTIQRAVISHQSVINVEQLAQGIYLIKLDNNQIQKLIKN